MKVAIVVALTLALVGCDQVRERQLAKKNCDGRSGVLAVDADASFGHWATYYVCLKKH